MASESEIRKDLTEFKFAIIETEETPHNYKVIPITELINQREDSLVARFYSYDSAMIVRGFMEKKSCEDFQDCQKATEAFFLGEPKYEIDLSFGKDDSFETSPLKSFKLPILPVKNEADLVTLDIALAFRDNRNELYNIILATCNGKRNIGLKTAYKVVFSKDMITKLGNGEYGDLDSRLITLINERCHNGFAGA